ncbi:MAG: FecR domain-containing protein [Pseudomonadota bacterium]
MGIARERDDSRRIAQRAHWFRERLSQPDLTAGERQEFEEWLRADYRHALAFERATLVWDALGDMSAGDFSAEVRHESRPVSSRLCDLRYLWSTYVRDVPGTAALWFGVVFLMAVAFSSQSMRKDGFKEGYQRVSYATPVGESELVSLRDGSLLTLGPDTSVDVVFNQRVRDVHLQRGVVFLDVASDKSRPLRAMAGALQVRALGTMFSVKLASGISRVSVAEGVVSVSYPMVIAGKPGTGRRVQRITKGEQIAALHAEGLQDVEMVRPEWVGAWRDRKLDYFRATVAELVDDLGRISTLEVSVEDPEGLLDQETFTAYFDASDVKALVRKLPAVLPVEVQEKANGALIIRPGEAAKI